MSKKIIYLKKKLIKMKKSNPTEVEQSQFFPNSDDTFHFATKYSLQQIFYD